MAEKMSPAERMQAVMMGQKPDVVPVIPFELGYAAQITGISLGDFIFCQNDTVTALCIAADSHRFPLKLRMFQEFHGSVETIHITVKDDSVHEVFLSFLWQEG